MQVFFIQENIYIYQRRRSHILRNFAILTLNLAMTVIKLQMTRRTKHTTYVKETKTAYKILVENPQGTSPPAQHRVQ
jgi:hypothetical protein